MAGEFDGDRRIHDRTDAQVRVKLRFENVKNLRLFYSKDISQGGIFIASMNPKPIGTAVEVMVYPPGVDLGFPLQGRVVRVLQPSDARARGLQPGMGIQFQDLTDDKRAAIQAYIASLGDEETAAAPTPKPAAPLPQPASAHQESQSTLVRSLDDIEPGEPEAAADLEPPQEPDVLQIELKLENREQLKKLAMNDLAKGALFVRTPQVRPVDSPVAIRLLVQGMATGMRLSGTVVRTVVSSEKGKDLSGIGIGLTDFTQAKRAAIERYLKGQAPDIAVQDESGAAPAEFGLSNPPETGPPELEPEALTPLPTKLPATLKPEASADTMVGVPPPLTDPTGAADKVKIPANLELLDSAMKEFEVAMKAKTYFDQLGLPSNTILDEIKSSYLGLSKKFHPDFWVENASLETIERLQRIQMHLRSVYDTLSNPEKRAAYEVSKGINVDDGDDLLQAARQKKRNEFRMAYARKYGDHISKGERLMEAAMEDIRAGKTKSALSNIRLALSFDPLNEKYRKLLKTVLEKKGL